MANNLSAPLALFSDLASLFDVPTNTVGYLFQQMMGRRVETARELLFDELRRGRITAIDAAHRDQFVAIVYRFLRAAQEGAARTNLRLLARIIRGMLVRSELLADNFPYYADMLAGLKRQELILLGTLHRHRKAFEAEIRSGKTTHPYTRTEKELVPTVFHNAAFFRAVCTSLTRTGLVFIDSGGHAPYGETVFTTSELMDRLEELASIEGVLAEEAVGPH